jgi:pyrroloquinoline quinone biosynthesis protein B
MNYRLLAGIFLVFISCKDSKPEQSFQVEEPYIFVLGVAQDAGYPQAGCEKACCERVYQDSKNKRFVSSIALVDPISKEYWIFDATPDFREQLKLVSTHLNTKYLPNGILLTHAHIGHYTGLMHLGREAIGAENVPVYAMPKMHSFLSENGPWSQLVLLKNIRLNPIEAENKIVLNERISVVPFPVPHRDEYSETVGFRIEYNDRSAVFIPDIDKWNRWDTSIVDVVKDTDIALLDATFFEDGEIEGRSMSEIPHPFVTESMNLFEGLSSNDKTKIYFTHFNHTNPLLIEGSPAQKAVILKGFNIAKQRQTINF